MKATNSGDRTRASREPAFAEDLQDLDITIFVFHAPNRNAETHPPEFIEHRYFKGRCSRKSS
jgi:hypothetical protein